MSLLDERDPLEQFYSDEEPSGEGNEKGEEQEDIPSIIKRVENKTKKIRRAIKKASR
jgi:hypothetical protein